MKNELQNGAIKSLFNDVPFSTELVAGTAVAAGILGLVDSFAGACAHGGVATPSVEFAVGVVAIVAGGKIVTDYIRQYNREHRIT